MNTEVDYSEYNNILDYLASIDEIRRPTTMEGLINQMGLENNIVGGFTRFFIIDKDKWMLAKIKHGF